MGWRSYRYEGRAIAVVPVNRIPAMVQLIPAEGFNGDSARRLDASRGITDFEYTRMRGTPFIVRRRLIQDRLACPARRRRSARSSR